MGDNKMSNGFTRRKEQSKDEIRKAAWELFGQFGVEKVSIVDIAHKAGVSQATIYNNFEGKETLVKEFMTKAINELVDIVREVIIPDKPYQEKMVAFIQLISKVLSDSKYNSMDSLRVSTLYNLLNDPEIRKIRNVAQDELTNLLLEMVREGKDQGYIHTDLSENAFRIYLKVFMDIYIDPQLQNQFHKDPKLVQDLCTLMLNGLGGLSK